MHPVLSILSAPTHGKPLNNRQLYAEDPDGVLARMI